MPRVTLLRLVVRQGVSSSKDLADALGVSTADLPGLLVKLEAVGYVTRVRSPSDRRVIHIEATTRGRRKLESLYRAAMGELSTLFAGWSEKDLRSLRDLLRRIGPIGPCPHPDGRLPVLHRRGRGGR